MTQTSRAVRIHAHGGPEQLVVDTVEVGEPGPGEVRIRHEAVGLNFIDVYQRTGLYQNPLPLTLGMEGAGVIEAVGPGVMHLKAGDRAAYAAGKPGSYSDLRVMPAMNVCQLPDAIDFETGAAMMLKGLTAQYLLRRCRPVEGLEPGDFVLFHAAAGGVGLIACQWAKALGLRLIGTAGSDEKCALAQAHGAEFTINYRTENFAERVKDITAGQGVKVVYDSVGKDTWATSLECVAPRGLLVSFGNASGPVTGVNLGVLAQKGSLFVTRPTLGGYADTPARLQAMADELFGMIASGAIRVEIGQRYALAEVAQAHADLAGRRTQGSSVLLP